MVSRKDIAVAILATFCLTSTLFMVVPIRSDVGTTSANEYDPWIDANDDGIIDIFDIAALALAFGAEGEPINKTDLLFQLLNRIDQLNSTVIAQQDEINNLNIELAILNSTKLGKPDYDSGWFAIAKGTDVTLQHGLNTTELMVYFIGRGYYGLSQMFYGGFNEVGAYWRTLTSESIIVTRFSQDDYWSEARVFMWKIPDP